MQLTNVKTQLEVEFQELYIENLKVHFHLEAGAFALQKISAKRGEPQSYI